MLCSWMDDWDKTCAMLQQVLWQKKGHIVDCVCVCMCGADGGNVRRTAVVKPIRIWWLSADVRRSAILTAVTSHYNTKQIMMSHSDCVFSFWGRFAFARLACCIRFLSCFGTERRTVAQASPCRFHGEKSQPSNDRQKRTEFSRCVSCCFLNAGEVKQRHPQASSIILSCRYE